MPLNAPDFVRNAEQEELNRQFTLMRRVGIRISPMEPEGYPCTLCGAIPGFPCVNMLVIDESVFEADYVDEDGKNRYHGARWSKANMTSINAAVKSGRLRQTGKMTTRG